MAGDQFGTVLRYLRKLTGAFDPGEQPDAVLLNRFATERDETAFAGLMDRYAPMVLGVGRRILGNSSDAEDAFQATFFVLARKAGSISRPEQLGNWLYGVAYRTALKAKTEMGRRRLREHLAPPRPTSDTVLEAVWRDLRPILDEEVNRLPVKYRVAFLLCHVEGKTNAEAARQLRCPVGTILSRLARARRQLRNRLTRRGVTLSVAFLTSSISRESLAAEVSAELMQSTVRMALSFAAVSGISQSFAAILAEGVLQAMFLNNIKTIGLSLLA
ncbi:MAG TPA: sigma-70 family RNA polymerase sigma factor, partial [Gemmataceae bacterium]|nr:sigma-70 family RNA polymerase sigma factor [Gemmataceae bacterium]